MDLKPLPGFRDFFPEEAAGRDYLFEKWRKTARSYGFSAYDGPPLENSELYRRKSGEELLSQVYCFTDKGERDVSLRPEMTPSLARMIAAQGTSLPKPIKWFSIPQLFRYERQQRGRLREHFQFNCDILGEEGIEAEAELIALLVDSLRVFGLKAEDFRVGINDRRLLALLFTGLGAEGEEKHLKLFAATDKLTRGSPEEVRAMIVAAGFDAGLADKVLELFRLKSLQEIAFRFESHPQICERVLTIQRLFGLLEATGLKDFVEFDPAIVRGLAYYTGIVFEAFDRKGKLRAISGGGRYDHLVEKIGGVKMAALGFGMGDVVLGELLSERNLWPQDLSPSVEIYIVLVEEGLRRHLLSLAHELRDQGFSVDYDFSTTAVGKQFKAAARRGAKAAIILGPEEWKRESVKIKNLQTREETEARAEKIGEMLRRMLKN